MNAQRGEQWLRATSSDDLWDDELTAVSVDGVDLILMRVGGAAVAYEDKCPHSGTPLSDGNFRAGVLTCASHLWQFDARSGEGINPKECALTGFPLLEEDGVIYVRIAR